MAVPNQENVHEFEDGEVYVFVQDEVIFLKAVASHGDPVELRTSTARKLAQCLLELADQVGD
jgi:hypothetical protein